MFNILLPVLYVYKSVHYYKGNKLHIYLHTHKTYTKTHNIYILPLVYGFLVKYYKINSYPCKILE